MHNVFILNRENVQLVYNVTCFRYPVRMSYYPGWWGESGSQGRHAGWYYPTSSQMMGEELEEPQLVDPIEPYTLRNLVTHLPATPRYIPKEFVSSLVLQSQPGEN